MTPHERWLTLVQYLNVKIEECDWHGVSDAANDLRVLEAQHPSLTNRLPPSPQGLAK